ncbi:TetR family transcriptional regulator [Pedobacter sp. HMWF019]|uniref:TetR/AcrR family transcriptional regulator n=1 Tax=Pedobacter sp. HMWF019 TaxID=2056856 RepID=UPI000D3C1F1F|nr:TetR/AcrR family transcriptional regulator [Pedobacter sp. HMWF019]PTT01856.1 TetR family transcriptional regulator [Pedobacter sp. HMWF019]
MSSKDRIQRLRETNRRNIIKVASQIVKTSGLNALSMRKIADKIDYTAPMIYSYFPDKDALIGELTRTGFLALKNRILLARNVSEEPIFQIEAMWMAYWRFAFEEKELYQAMFGVEMPAGKIPTGIITLQVLFSEVIIKLNSDAEKPDENTYLSFYRYWSAIHGLIAINLICQNISEQDNSFLLKRIINDVGKAISGV